tara:strand:+ start:3230 stop:3445 length:216 start_codon:yes stop_codon:yes gene_type:complete
MVCVAIEEIQAPFRCFCIRASLIFFVPSRIAYWMIPEVPFPEYSGFVSRFLEMAAYRREIEVGASERISIV